MARNFIPLVPSGTINADASVAQLEQDVLAMDSKVGELAEDIGDTEQEINQLKSEIDDLDEVVYYIDKSALGSHYFRNSYISGGEFKNSASWESYVFNIKELNIQSIEASLYSNSIYYEIVGFYSSETPSNATYISGILPTAQGKNDITISNFPNNAKSVVLCNRIASGEASATVKCAVIGLSDGVIKADMLAHGQYPYFGEHIALSRNTITKKLLYDGTITVQGGSPQSAVVQFPYLFYFGSGGYVKVIDISASVIVELGNFALEEIGGIAPHCNVAFFGTNKYDPDDLFPVVYVNAYQSTLPNGTLYGYRIQMTESGGVKTFTFTLVQTITVGFTDQEDWADQSDSRPYGNFVCDTDNGILYAYVIRDTLDLTRFFSFAMPDLSSASVTLVAGDVIETFDTEYFNIIQDNAYDDGNIYISHGTTNGGKIECVSTVKQKRVSTIDLTLLEDNKEPEICAVYNGKMLVGNGILYWMDFSV